MDVEIPEFQRKAHAFEDDFAVEPGKVIVAMNGAGSDVATQEPRISIQIPSVRIQRRGVPVLSKSPFGTWQNTVLPVDVTISLPVASTTRGIHVSRIGDALARLACAQHPDLRSFAHTLATDVARTQEAATCEVFAECQVSYLERVKGWKTTKDKLSLETLGVFASAKVSSDPGAVDYLDGVEFSHLTACPCVQKVYQHTLAQDGTSPPIPPSVPLITHSQRCRSRISLGRLTAALDVPALVTVLDSVLCRTQNTLPREQELRLVFEAHARPYFIEDVVREVAYTVCKELGPSFEDGGFLHITSRSNESIHDFDLVAELQVSVAEIAGMSA